MSLTTKLGIGILATGLMLVLAYFMLRSYTDPKALGGFSSNPSPITITMAETRLNVPLNMIRFQNQRQRTELSKLDLFVQWPTMQGFTNEEAAIFENIARMDELIFISLDV